MTFMPHGHCYFWSGPLIGLHAISDALIVIAYYSIPISLVYFVRRRTDLEFHWMFVCFALFILACGTTHLLEIWNIWHSSYWLSGTIKALTAVASVPTAVLLVRLVPRALALPSPAQLRQANEDLRREIGERQRFERELQEKNLELERANQAKDRFLATMSHELRTPLNAVIGFTGTLLMKLPGPLNEAQEKQLRTVRGSARHLLSLINDLLDLARVESGRIELAREPLDVGAVLHEVVAAVRPAAEAKRLELQVDAPSSAVILQTDRRALSQILLNLAGNAVKFTEAGLIRCGLASRQENGRRVVEFSVADTGIGISAEDQAKLFIAFSRVGDRAQRRDEGAGLGLHLSQKLAGLLGGIITVESAAGKGSRFTLVLQEA